MRKFTLIIIFSSIAAVLLANAAHAYWVWTPETKKFINPKYAVKDSPKEQFDWAMSFYDAKDFQRAATEFEKLAKQYEFSEYASKAQYYVGLCYENMGKFYIAFENYQKAIDNFPHIENMEEILAREYNIGNIYLNKSAPKVLKTDIMAPLDRAVDIFKKVVANAPYGKYAEDAQFKLGEALKKSERYEEAVEAFHKLTEDYPKSKLTAQAMFEEADCAYKASLKPAYDVASTDNAIKAFQKFVNKNKDTSLVEKADVTMKRLKDNVAEKSFRTAEFYEAQGKKEAAIIYYQDVIDTYPDSSFVATAKAKIDALKNKDQKKIEASLEAAKKKSQEIAQQKEKKQKAILERKAGKEKAIADRQARKQKTIADRQVKKQKVMADRDARKQKIAADREAKKQKILADREARKQKAAAGREARKKGSWNLLGFMSKKPSESPKPEPVVQQAEPPKAAPVVQQVEAPKPSPVIQEPVMPEPQAAVQAVEAPKIEPEAKPDIPKQKGWKPFRFDSKKEDQVREVSERKPWNLFGLGAKKEWKPLKP